MTSCFVSDARRGVVLLPSEDPNKRVKESEFLRGLWLDEDLLLGGVHNTLKISLEGLRTLKQKIKFKQKKIYINN